MSALPSTIVMTSELSVAPKFDGCAPDAASSALITRYDEAVPSRVRSPQEAENIVKARSAMGPANFATLPPQTAFRLTRS